MEITKEIEIDAGHRVAHHESKCRNLHGHRYRIQATISGALFEEGSQTGMVMDFSFLKQVMVQFIDANCDHALILWVGDRDLVENTIPFANDDVQSFSYASLQSWVTKNGSWRYLGRFGWVYAVPFTPTAENLAKHWFDLLAERVPMRTNGKAKLVRLRVWETPTSFAEHTPCE